MTLLTSLNKSSPTLTDLHVPSIPDDGEKGDAWDGFDWRAVHDALAKEMERRGMAHEGEMQKARPRRDKCMLCKQEPSIEVLWAEGKAHAWFCSECYRGWKAEHPGEVDYEKKIEHGIARQKFGDQQSPKQFNKAELEPISKPYTMETLPEAVKGLPKHAREIWLAAYNSASEQYEEEERRFKVAWAAIKTKYRQVDGRWVRKSDDGEYHVPIIKYEEDEFRGLVYGVVLSPYQEAPTEDDVDTQGDVISKEEVEAACHNFMLRGHRLDLHHKEDVPDDEAAVVECYVAPADFEDGAVREGDWVMAVQLKTEELKKAAQDGDIAYFSVRGTGYRKDVELGIEKQEDTDDMVTLLEELNKASFTNAPWDKSETNKLSAADYCRVCLVDYNPPGEEKIKARCKLPVRTSPGAPVNRNAVRNAASRLPQMEGVPAEHVQRAKRRLERLKQQAEIGGD